MKSGGAKNYEPMCGACASSPLPCFAISRFTKNNVRSYSEQPVQFLIHFLIHEGVENEASDNNWLEG